MKKKHTFLGHLLAAVAVAATDAGLIQADPLGVVTNPAELQALISGFVNIFAQHTNDTATDAPFKTVSAAAAGQ